MIAAVQGVKGAGGAGGTFFKKLDKIEGLRKFSNVGASGCLERCRGWCKQKRNKIHHLQIDFKKERD